MWRLVKAEFSYNRYVVVFLCLGIYGLLMAFSRRFPDVDFLRFMDCCEANHFKSMHLMQTVMFIFTVTALVTRATRKRDRIHSLLPLSAGRIGISRQLGLLVIWMIVVFLFLMNHLIFRASPFTGTTVWGLVALNGFVLIIVSLFLTAYDFKHLIRRDYKILNVYNDDFFTIIIAVGAYSIWLLSSSLYDMNSSVWAFVIENTPVSRSWFFSLYGACVINLLAAGLIYLNRGIFVSRRSFLE